MPNQDLTKLIDDLSTWAKDRVDDYVAASKSTIGKVIDGNYTGQEVTDDLNKAWKMWAEDVQALVAMLPSGTPKPDNP